MFKNIIIVTCLSMGIQALEVQEKRQLRTYQIVINTNATKATGRPWDVTGGAPDIMVLVNGKILPMPKRCKNRYKCTMTFISSKKSFYIEAYDKDLINHDLIGKNTCSAYMACKINNGSIRIKRKKRC